MEALKEGKDEVHPRRGRRARVMMFEEEGMNEEWRRRSDQFFAGHL